MTFNEKLDKKFFFLVGFFTVALITIGAFYKFLLANEPFGSFIAVGLIVFWLVSALIMQSVWCVKYRFQEENLVIRYGLFSETFPYEDIYINQISIGNNPFIEFQSKTFSPSKRTVRISEDRFTDFQNELFGRVNKANEHKETYSN